MCVFVHSAFVAGVAAAATVGEVSETGFAGIAVVVAVAVEDQNDARCSSVKRRS